MLKNIIDRIRTIWTRRRDTERDEHEELYF